MRYGLVLFALAALACSRREKPMLSVVVGNQAAERRTFSPETALAEYVALPGVRNELRLTLASYATSCERFVSPSHGQTLVNVVITTPSSDPPHAGRYPWSGTNALGQALPSAHFDEHAYEFPPGGEIRLDSVELDPHGRVTGVLAFEFPGDADRPEKSLRGNFDARICRVSEP